MFFKKKEKTNGLQISKDGTIGVEYSAGAPKEPFFKHKSMRIGGPSKRKTE
jgi:hypothetical protein